MTPCKNPWRSVRYLKDVPDYVNQRMVTEIGSIDAAEFKSLEATDRLLLYRLMFNLPDSLRVPELEMPFDLLENYLRSRWTCLGRRCLGLDISNGMDWEWQHGAVGFEMNSSEDGKQPGMEDPVPWLRNRFTGEKVPCPSRWGVKYGAVGTTWCIRDNWSVETAKLENVMEKEVFGLCKQFKLIEARLSM